MRQFVILTFILLSAEKSLTQKKIGYYLAIPSDSTLGYRLNFINDSIVELSNMPQHMSKRLSVTFKYFSTNTATKISSKDYTEKDSLLLELLGLQFFIKSNIILTKIDKLLIDYNNSLLYVRQKDFDRNPDITYIIDHNTYIYDVGKTDGYGIVIEKAKKNNKLQKKLDVVAENRDKYNIEFLKGLKAYQRFGIKGIYGVVIITTKT